MDRMTFVVVDAERALSAQLDGDFVNVLVPALSDDPETLEELSYAMRRFLPLEDGPSLMANWASVAADTPGEAELCLVDLPGRLIVFQSATRVLMRSGQVSYDDRSERNPRWIPYHLADDWEVCESPLGWQDRARERREQRRLEGPFDTRAVIYGKLSEFLVTECFAVRGGTVTPDGGWLAPAGWEWRELTERVSDGKPVQLDDVWAEIHARWLMTPREDLRGQSPRQVLMAQRDTIVRQIQDREYQWTSFGTCPAGLWSKSQAYRFGGYGIHETVLYYDLVRHLLKQTWKLVADSPSEPGSPGHAALIERIDGLRREWMSTESEDEYFGQSPGEIIDMERLRLPQGREGADAMIDCDCPMCQMMAEQGPVFWHLDGSHLDDDFAFSIWCDTREEWEDERLSWSDPISKEVLAEAGPLRTAMETAIKDRETSGSIDSDDSIWKRSWVNEAVNESPVMALMGFAMRLSELVTDLREIIGGDQWIESLLRHFGNLREATAQPGKPLVRPVATALGEELQRLAEERMELRLKCLDLEQQVSRFAARFEPDEAGA